MQVARIWSFPSWGRWRWCVRPPHFQFEKPSTGKILGIWCRWIASKVVFAAFLCLEWVRAFTLFTEYIWLAKLCYFLCMLPVHAHMHVLGVYIFCAHAFEQHARLLASSLMHDFGNAASSSTNGVNPPCISPMLLANCFGWSLPGAIAHGKCNIWAGINCHVFNDGYVGDNAASADLRSWADVYTPGQPGPQRTLTLYQVKAEGRQQAQDVNLILSIYDKVAAAVQR